MEGDVTEEEGLNMYYEYLMNPNVEYLDIITGEYNNGKASGKFKMYCNEYLVYDGETSKDQREGKGTSYFYGSKQKQYDGEWKNGQYHGKGTEYDKNGNKLYSGEWKNGDYAH